METSSITRVYAYERAARSVCPATGLAIASICFVQ